MAATKPLKLYGHFGPNPWKVEIILKELGIPFETEEVAFNEVKNAAFTAVNPNGRLPALHDPNTDLTIWESGAIVEYLIHQYDAKAQKLSFAENSADDWHTKQWLYFQATGQGPYYGQATWFSKYHPVQHPDAIERYVKEINRVTGVLDKWLGEQKAKHGGDDAWLVGGKMSYADLSFVPWQFGLSRRHAGGFDEDQYPNAKAWLAKMAARPSVKEILARMPNPPSS